MVALRQFRSTKPSFADLTPYAGLVADGVILLKDGSLMAGWYFAGPDSESSTNSERNEVSRQVNAILARLGSGWMIGWRDHGFAFGATLDSPSPTGRGWGGGTTPAQTRAPTGSLPHPQLLTDGEGSDRPLAKYWLTHPPKAAAICGT